MKKKSVVFFSVIFPANEKYFNDFLKSISEQTFNDFDLLLYNDGLNNIDFYVSRYCDKINVKIISNEKKLSPAGIREYALNYLCKTDYEVIIFGDTDDFFADNRVEVTLKCIKDNDIVINDLTLYTEDKKVIYKNYLSQRLNNNSFITFNDIKTCNFLGLSNTAVKRNSLFSIKIDDNLIAVDWFFFSLLLLKGNKAVFINETTTFYRQHSENQVGLNNIDDKTILKGLKVKEQHYKLLSSLNNDMLGMYYSYRDILKRIESDKKFFNRYAIYIKSIKIDYPLWWEEIKECEL